MEEQSLLDCSDIGPAVFVIRSATRSCFDVSRLFSLAQNRFHEVTVRRVETMRERWRLTTMEVLHAKLRVRELHEAQHSIQDTFGHHQARSLLLALKLDGFCAHRTVSQSELSEMLRGYLPEKECAVLIQFVISSAPPPAHSLPAPPQEHTSKRAVASSTRIGPRMPEEAGALPDAAGYPNLVVDASDVEGGLRQPINGVQVAVGVAVLCDGPIDERMRLCFEAFDEGAKGALEPAELNAMLLAIYRTYYREPPSAEEVAAFAEVVFVLNTPVGKLPSKTELLRYYEQMREQPTTLQPVPIERYLHLAAGQPMVALCFSKRKRLLRTPRITRRGLREVEAATASSYEAMKVESTFGSSLLPICVMRRPKGAAADPSTNRTGPRITSSSTPGSSTMPSATDFQHQLNCFGRSAASVVSDALGGALDGALSAMQVPPKRNPLGAALLESSRGQGEGPEQIERLCLAMAEAGLDTSLRPHRLKVCIGFDCGESNMKAGKQVFRGKPLHHSAEDLLGPDPNPYQMAIFMLGKALECIGYEGDVGCFCFNTAVASPRAATAAAAQPARCQGMEAALHYYNQLPPSLFRGAKGASVASGLAQAVERASAIADEAVAEGALLTMCVLLTTGQGFDPQLSRAAFDNAHTREGGLSLLCLGLGDGPFHELGRLAAAEPMLFNAFDFHALLQSAKFPDRKLALEAFRVLPEQAHALELNRKREPQT